MILQIILDIRRIDLGQRLREGKVLTIDEIEEIVSKCKLPLEKISKHFDKKSREHTTPEGNVTSLESVRMRRRGTKRTVVSNDADRVLYIRLYLDELVKYHSSRLDQGTTKYLALELARKHTVDALKARAPKKRRSGPQRISLTDKQIWQLWTVLSPESPENPFKNKFIRHRNALIFQYLILLGVRRGELLGVRLDDIKWPDRMIAVVRRHDNKQDKRKREAKAKTLSRLLPVSDELLLATHEYLTAEDQRRKYIPEGALNPFLFVSRNGDPLTTSGLQKVFEEVRNAFPDFPTDLSPHLCRHTCNYLLSLAFDAEGISEKEEAARRRALMGWSSTSLMPDHYNFRRIVDKANKSSLKAQEMYTRRRIDTKE